jgi:hypothetical protein
MSIKARRRACRSPRISPKAHAPSSIPSRKYAQQNVVDGKSTTEVPVSISELQKGNLAITSTRAPRTSRPTSRAATTRGAAAAQEESTKKWRNSEVAGSTPIAPAARRLASNCLWALARRAFYIVASGDAMRKLVYPFLLWALLAAAAQAQDAASLAQRVVERSGLAVQLQSTPKYFEEQIAALRGKVPDACLLALARPAARPTGRKAMAQEIAQTLAETMKQPQEMERVLAWLETGVGRRVDGRRGTRVGRHERGERCSATPSRRRPSRRARSARS